MTSRTLLVAGALAGLAAAIASITVRGGPASMPADAVAVVNGAVIRVADFDRAVGAVTSDRRDPIGADDRRALLDRLIEEELLVQRARELGLDTHDPAVRARLVAAMVEAGLAGVAAAPPADADVARFYDDERAALSPATRVWVRALRVASDADDPMATRNTSADGRASPRTTAEGGDQAASRARGADRAREAVTRLRAGDDF